MTDDEEKKIAAWGRALADEISIDLTLTRDRRGEEFQYFCENVSRLAPKIRLQKESEEEQSPPVIRIHRVRYQAIPGGSELDPFLSFLGDSSVFAGQLPADVTALLDKIRVPAFLKIYIMPLCPFCPAAVKQLLALAGANRWINLTVIDGSLFPELAESDKIRSAPTVLLEDRFRWTGSFQVREVVDVILNRDPSQLSASSLKEMISNGEAEAVAKMMIDSGKLFPAFIDLLTHEKWPVRLGAMVAFETVLEDRRELAIQAIPVLWACFSEANDTVRGDILYVLGTCRDEGVIPLLETVLSGPYPVGVKEAAAEALEGFSSRG